MANHQVPGGKVRVADSAIVSTVRDAVLSSYGVVDLAPRSLASAIGQRIGIRTTARGIGLKVNDNRVTIEISVVMEYGVPIFTVASNVMQSVRFQVERVLGMDVERVDINVDGLHVSTRGTA